MYRDTKLAILLLALLPPTAAPLLAERAPGGTPKGNVTMPGGSAVSGVRVPAAQGVLSPGGGHLQPPSLHSSPIHPSGSDSGARSPCSSLTQIAGSSHPSFPPLLLTLNSTARDHDLVEEQGDLAPEPSRERPCADAASRQFDFWIGEWDVFAGEALAGHNSIRPLADGCVLHESWRGAQGSAGTSLNFFNTQTRKWQQFWVWRNGTTLELEGGLRDGRMVLEGESVNAEGGSRRNRITWSENDDGTVRQLWEISTSDTAGWRTAFDGHYRKSESVAK